MSRFGMRSHAWGPLRVVVVAGEIDVDSAARLGSQLRKLQRGSDLVIDLWDVTGMDPVAVGVLAAAKRRSDEAGWGFAVVADPTGPCCAAFEEADELEGLKPYRSRQDARRALQLASP